MELHKLELLRIAGKKFELIVKPFDWEFKFSKNVFNYGDRDTHTIKTLCFEFGISLLNEKGKAGIKYRKQLKKELIEKEIQARFNDEHNL